MAGPVEAEELAPSAALGTRWETGNCFVNGEHPRGEERRRTRCEQSREKVYGSLAVLS